MTITVGMELEGKRKVERGEEKGNKGKGEKGEKGRK